MSSRPTMEDVAREANVGRMTVSRVLNQPELVSADTLAAVRAAIERLGYVPNLNAGSLASNRSRIVGAVIPTIENAFFSDTISGLSQVLAAKGYQLLLGQSLYSAKEELRLIDAFVGRRVDGIMLIRTAQANDIAGTAKRAGIPILEAWDTSNKQIDMLVGFSHTEAGRAAARHLHSKGRRHLGYLGSNEARSRARLQGFRAGAKAAGVPPVHAIMLDKPSSINDAKQTFPELLERCSQLDAVFCSSDMLAAGVLFECQRLGLHVPEKISIVGFADLPIASATYPQITTIHVPSLEIGNLAGEMLFDCIQDKRPANLRVNLGFNVVERGTT